MRGGTLNCTQLTVNDGKRAAGRQVFDGSDESLHLSDGQRKE